MPRWKKTDGFTLIELMIVIAVIGLLAAVLLPSTRTTHDMACALADESNLRVQHTWLQDYQRKLGHWPMHGGHRFVLATWSAGVMEHTPENFERFWTPGTARDCDPVFHELHRKTLRDQEPLPALAATDTGHTHYVGRARSHLASLARGAKEAWIANDNEGRWSLRDGTVNVLFGGGAVRSYSYQLLQELYGLGPFDPEMPIATWGPDAPIAACRKLDN